MVTDQKRFFNPSSAINKVTAIFKLSKTEHPEFSIFCSNVVQFIKGAADLSK